ncbi:MAG: hypothetical protein M3301_07395 [Chloroflexota bacterium]|nr:hypothetical protein [Chloroflexota bacterium]
MALVFRADPRRRLATGAALAILATALIAGLGRDTVEARVADGAALAQQPGRPAPVAERPLVLAYYYIWYTPNSWFRAKTDLPAAGRYASDDPKVVARHVAWAREAGIDAFVVSWKHEARLDAPLELVAKEARRQGVKLVLLYQGLDFDREPLDPTRIARDLQWFTERYGNDPVFQVFGNKPAVVWSGTWKFSASQIGAVRQQIGAPGRILLLGTEKDGDSYGQRASLLDGDAYYWSSADPLSTPRYGDRLDRLGQSVAADKGIWVAPAAPGFDARLVGGTSIVPRRDGATYRESWAGALATGPTAIGIISWNEFSENSQIEPSRQYGTEYLHLTRELVGTLPGGAPAEAPPGGGLSAPAPRPQALDLYLTLATGLALAVLVVLLGWHLRRRPVG